MNYCDFAHSLPSDTDNPNKHYHDHEYGFPVTDDNELFGRLLLEINQAGLSWTLILRKQADFRAAYAQFDIATVAAFDETDIQRLLDNPRIVRNRLKIQAAVYNARKITVLQKQYGSFCNWLDHLHPLDKAGWVKHFRTEFKFVGGEIVGEFLMSTGYLPGAHHEHCPAYPKILAARPAWLREAGR